MKLLLTGSAVAISLGLGAISAEGLTSPPRAQITYAQASRSSTAKVASARKGIRKRAAKPSQPHQGYRCSGPSAGDGKSPPTGAAVVKRFKLTRLTRPTPTSAVVQVDVTLTKPHKLATFSDVPGSGGEGVMYTYTTTSGTVAGDGPRATWTVEGVGTWTITLEIYNRASGCVTFTSATYTIGKPRPTRSKGSAEPEAASAAPKPQWEIDYDQKMAVYEQELAKQKQAVADYERQKAEVEARRAELRVRADSSQAQWRAAVAACQAGDYSQCAPR